MSQEFSNIIFSYESISEDHAKSLNKLLTSSPPSFRIETCYMKVYDSSDPEQADPKIVFGASARLQQTKNAVKLQQLKLSSGLPNTYVISLEAVFDPHAEPNSRIYKITGRGTSEARSEARKVLLAGLSGSTYNCSIEEARNQVAYKFSDATLEMLFASKPELITLNTELARLWFSSYLGKI